MTEQWVVLCLPIEGYDDVMVVHGPFADRLRGARWADQHREDVNSGRRDKCPTTAQTIWTQTLRLEGLR